MLAPLEIADGDDLSEKMERGLLPDEGGEVAGAADEVLLVEHARGDAAEEAGHAVFENLAPRAQQGRAGPEQAPDGQEVVLVSSCSVKEEQGGRISRFEDEGHGRGVFSMG